MRFQEHDSLKFEEKCALEYVLGSHVTGVLPVDSRISPLVCEVVHHLLIVVSFCSTWCGGNAPSAIQRVPQALCTHDLTSYYAGRSSTHPRATGWPLYRPPCAVVEKLTKGKRKQWKVQRLRGSSL